MGEFDDQLNEARARLLNGGFSERVTADLPILNLLEPHLGCAACGRRLINGRCLVCQPDGTAPPFGVTERIRDRVTRPEVTPWRPFYALGRNQLRIGVRRKVAGIDRFRWIGLTWQ